MTMEQHSEAVGRLEAADTALRAVLAGRPASDSQEKTMHPTDLVRRLRDAADLSKTDNDSAPAPDALLAEAADEIGRLRRNQWRAHGWAPDPQGADEPSEAEQARRTAAGSPPPTPGPTIKVGVASMLARDGKVLVGRRLGAHGEGMWSVPGGHPMFGESWAETAAREAFEETGLTMCDPVFVAVTNDVEPNLGTHYVTIWMLGQCPDGESVETEPDRFVDHRWVSLNELPEPLFWPWEQLLSSEFMPSVLALLSARPATVVAVTRGPTP